MKEDFMPKPEKRSQQELDAIEDLISTAEKITDEKIKQLGQGEESWSEFFHQEMVRLRTEAGLM
jgi:hypothetical protein